MDPIIISAIIGAFGVIIAAIIGPWIRKRKKIEKTPIKNVNPYKIEYIDDLNFPTDFFNEIPTFPVNPITLDARYRKQLVKKNHLAKNKFIKFQNIQISDDKCSWYCDNNLLNRYKFKNSSDRSYSSDTFDISLKPLYHEAKYFFHQGNNNSKKKVKDPILDITLSNLTSKKYILYSIGICPLALWAIPKMVIQPEIIKVFDIYYIKCNFEKLLCNIVLRNPIAVSSDGIFRFQICLKKYIQELSRFGSNESLIAIVINNGLDTFIISDAIYLGIIG